MKGIGGGCDEAGVKAFQGAANFVPANQRGKAVQIRMAMPITFQLKDGETNPDGSPQGVVSVGEVQMLYADLKKDTHMLDSDI